MTYASMPSLTRNLTQVAICSSWLLTSACGGRAEIDASDGNLGGTSTGAGGAVVNGTGGEPFTGTGGAAFFGTGGANIVATGGKPYTGTGGAVFLGTGGFVVAATGGKPFSGAGGSIVVATGGKPYSATGGVVFVGTGGSGATGGKTSSEIGGGTLIGAGGTIASATGGTSGTISCANVTCPSIPVTCIQIVQSPGSCCPTCVDTGCPPCPNPICPTGTHVETPAGACCPECVVDKPDACTQGRTTYASMRASMLEKYGSTGCKNSSECVIVPENNQCASTCGNPLPSSMVSYLTPNLDSNAQTLCATCPKPTPVPCVLTLPSCVNGKCVAVNSQ